MRYFLIRYRLENAPADEWRQEVERFIANIAADPELHGRITYRSLRHKNGEYFHLAGAADEAAMKALQSREFFRQYSERVKSAATGGVVDVSPLELIAETT